MTHFMLDTTMLDPRRRVTEFEAACAQICHLMIAPTSEDFASRTSIALIGSAVFADTRHSACVTNRTMTLAAETGDNILLHIPVQGGFTIRQRGGSEQACGVGSIYVDPTEEPGVARFDGAGAQAFYLSLPRAALGTAGDRLSLRGQVALTPQWRLMLAYACAIHAEAALLPAAHLERCGLHLQDLAMLAVGADHDDAQIARGRGVRAARLRAIRADVERHLADPDLAPDWIAKRHGVSPRYLRALFADEETSFSDHVRRRRLMLAWRRLSDPAQAGVPIGRIAMEAGFGDLSWFNHLFRKTFGQTPTETRNLSLRRLREAERNGPDSA